MCYRLYREIIYYWENIYLGYYKPRYVIGFQDVRRDKIDTNNG